MSNKDIFTTADILLPGSGIDKWSVIACDQFSSEPEYWERVRIFAGDKPSAFNMIIPEAFLEETDEESQAEKICGVMKEYLSGGIFKEIKDSLIYVRRTQSDGHVRRGLVGSIDLEAYDFAGKNTPIRASEGTILERLPARINIRKSACLEMPHIIAFINDKENSVFGALDEKADELETVYDFELMENGGHIQGKSITGDAAAGIAKAINSLHSDNGILMIIGDGNHSLAAAKVYWDELKQGLSEKDKENHPARRALVEICNVYDPAIEFNAIHRVLFNAEVSSFIREFEKEMPQGDDYILSLVSKEQNGEVGIKADCIGDMLELVQDFIDAYVRKTPKCTVDYIHGADAVRNLIKDEHCLGMILPAMDKSELFETVAVRGVFPRKSFSVGHARDKRYYLECRKIR